MSIETINYLLAKYYETLTNTQYLYQEETNNPSTYSMENEDAVSPKQRYRIEINLLKSIINELEELKDKLKDFEI